MRQPAVLLTALALVLASTPRQAGGARGSQARPSPSTGTAAWAIVDWATLTVADGAELERLRQPTLPGSIVKIATLAAALASGVASHDTRVPCEGRATVQGQAISCSHPRLRHPVRPAEALAVSCNVWFATIGARLPRARLDGMLRALGLPPSPPGAPMALSATGLRATPSPPLAWVEALARVLRPSSAFTPETRAVIADGLRGASLYGTASAFASRGLDAYVKTGTADAPGGGIAGVAVGAWPAAAPTRAIVVVAPGVAGLDAADLAARIAAGDGPARPPAVPPAPAVTSAEPTVGVGAPRPEGGYTVERLAIEEYVARVVAGEAAPRSPAAALEALAVAIRTFAAANAGRHRSEGFDLCTLTHCQVPREPTAAARAAAAATRGQILTSAGRPAEVFYTASCGGRTERPSAVWPGAADPAHLPSARDRACRGEPRWAAEIPVHDLERTLASAGFRGARLDALRIAGRTSSGRVAQLRLEGLTPSTMSGQDFRMLVGRALGWHLLKSTSFAVRRTAGGYRFDGEGFGHGVGLCVLGSVARAEDGATAREILRHYFPGASIGQAPAAPAARAPAPARPARPAPGPSPPPVRAAMRPVLVLPASSEPDRAALSRLLDRAVDDLARQLGVTPPAGLQVVFHPSAESFRRETGEPWWSAGKTRGTRVDLLPPGVLRARGTLDTTLRHELAHVLTEPVLGGRPGWVREGLAMRLSGEFPQAALDPETARRLRCPTDDQLGRPVSAADARQAYARAAACVAREMAAGTGWRDLR